MQLRLSYSSDVLPAISGFARLLANHFKYDYVAGLWKGTLTSDLLWYVKPQAKDRFPRPRPRDSFAPSWSWASIEMTQNIKHVKPEKQYTVRASDLPLREAIVEISCEPESPINPFGILKDAYLKFSGRLYTWYIRRFCRKAHSEMSRKTPRALKDLHVTRPNHGGIPSTAVNDF
ncbi:hypothetical protein BKA65DRAFT_166781 [Rhexocercosporidium sp. MPI-PUGE-AT-0058]|nr:hypothetical protein BKA65DRAFT_166781 [Rhexocercosporidium sp. MPI-PUGE-AT-0058]